MIINPVTFPGPGPTGPTSRVGPGFKTLLVGPFFGKVLCFNFFDALLCCYVVSGTHARLQKKGGDLLVTDLGSTNGTFIDEKRLTPGVPSVIPSGRYVTFGPIFVPSSTITWFL